MWYQAAFMMQKRVYFGNTNVFCNWEDRESMYLTELLSGKYFTHSKQEDHQRGIHRRETKSVSEQQMGLEIQK